MGQDIEQIVRAAGEAANAGRWQEADALWREVHRRDPADPRAAMSLAVHAMQRSDFGAARTLLEDALLLRPADPMLLLALARARRGEGDEPGEGQAIDAALAIDPYFLPALLMKAARFERLGVSGAAAVLYRSSLKIAPPEGQEPPAMRAQLAHARAFVRRYSDGLKAKLTAAIAPQLAGAPRATAERWREAVSIMAGASAPYRQEAAQIHVPRLPAIPFYDRDLFAWAADLEAKTDVIRQELTGLLEGGAAGFAPYIAIERGQPVDQWAQLNHSARWSHHSLWRHGAPNELNLARCPATRAALEAVDMASIEGLCPNAMFSALAPRTEIPPHHGETNARLVVHLPLIVPKRCTYRVGYERREWKVGEILVFDDTIEHTARNDSDDLRVVLIFDVWNPLLSSEERAIVSEIALAARAFAAL
ncbi:MAG: aspartyl/asparaginyl beta-hydroxylase domain-containing protein [Alphaproteobacteria bacterium]|nr:aspartyl/asparaginyl beta-hydroxylase domain-containing protein [Alphaproteobacteria bacterium]